MHLTDQEIKELILMAGFKIYGTTIVAADNGSAGLATFCAPKLIKLVIEKCQKKEFNQS